MPTQKIKEILEEKCTSGACQEYEVFIFEYGKWMKILNEKRPLTVEEKQKLIGILTILFEL